MSLAIALTTINYPEVIELYARYYHTAAIYIIGDEKTPHDAVHKLIADVRLCNVKYYDVYHQKSLSWQSSELFGWNTPLRRNIGFLEAARAGHSVIWTIDDDNIPMIDSSLPPSGFSSPIWGLEQNRTYSFDGVEIRHPDGWFDPNQLLQPRSVQRGFPHRYRKQANNWCARPTTCRKVGVVSGLILGSPDVDAVERIVNDPMRFSVDELARTGVVTDPRYTYTVFNSQNTAFLRELLPAMMMLPIGGKYSRYDDIYASAICQRVMAARDLCAHIGKPFAYQQRNEHDSIKDLKLEIDGMQNFLTFANELMSDPILRATESTVITEYVRSCHHVANVVPQEIVGAWLSDCERALNG